MTSPCQKRSYHPRLLLPFIHIITSSLYIVWARKGVQGPPASGQGAGQAQVQGAQGQGGCRFCRSCLPSRRAAARWRPSALGEGNGEHIGNGKQRVDDQEALLARAGNELKSPSSFWTGIVLQALSVHGGRSNRYATPPPLALHERCQQQHCA